MKKLFSIAIPTWEVGGKGVEYLEFSFNRIANQTIDLKTIEVVVSDHSLNNDIENLCDNWSSVLDIKYVKCDKGRGKIAPNLNNAIRHCEGSYIKILFQDDFLYDQHAMKLLYDRIISLGKIDWLVSACVHTKDGESLYDSMVPRYHSYIYRGHNTISCPSVLTIKNDEHKLFFDESLNWLVDVEYYKRMFDKFGSPEILENICVVNRDAEIRTTNITSEETKQTELQYVLKKYESQNTLDLSNVTLITMTSVRVDDHVKALQYSSNGINFGAIKLVSDIKPDNLPTGIQHEYTEKMSNIDEWSYSIIYKLGKHVDTDYAMLIHDDGFIINPSSWKKEFLEYDYIGAPWPIPKDNFSYRDINGKLIRVGNSVSLRSKKLIDLPVLLNLEWKPFHGYYNEDGYITVNYRHIYEEHGCKFADLDIAKYFSHEVQIPETVGIVPFAFHGKNNPHRKLIQ